MVSRGMRVPCVVGTPSTASSRSLSAILFPAYPTSAPDDPTTRWQGTMIGTGFQRKACATARAAVGLPTSDAMPAYEHTAPYGMPAVARSTARWNSLRATSEIPYGAVCSYAGLATELGKPSAARAVAQALRWNPLPIVVPCHRVVGSSGALVGYAGSKLGLKERLLAVEGVPTVAGTRLPRDAMYVTLPGESSYCLPTCAWIPTADHPQRFLRFGSRVRAEAAGLAPCTDCRPDLHPLAS